MDSQRRLLGEGGDIVIVSGAMASLRSQAVVVADGTRMFLILKRRPKPREPQTGT
jgi:hypothetical protein